MGCAWKQTIEPIKKGIGRIIFDGTVDGIDQNMLTEMKMEWGSNKGYTSCKHEKGV